MLEEKLDHPTHIPLIWKSKYNVVKYIDIVIKINKLRGFVLKSNSIKKIMYPKTSLVLKVL